MTNRFQFRIWSKRHNCWLENSSSLHCSSNWQIDVFTGRACDFVSALSGDEETFIRTHIADNDYIIQQYTGLKDSKRRKIYEGDILEYKTEFNKFKDLVFWNSGAFMIGKTIRNPIYYLHALNSHAKIIGNIFENKNLLK